MGDLDMIAGEISIGSNKISLAYDKTIWRPKYYSIIDAYVAFNIQEEIERQTLPSFFPYGLALPRKPNFYYLKLIPEGIWDGRKYLTYKPGFSDNIELGVYGGECVTYFNVQILAYMGCNPIVLLGVDFSFIQPPTVGFDPSYGEVYAGQGEVNHFDPNYRPVGEKWTMPNLKEQELSFEFAEHHLRTSGRRLLNCSRQTKLSVVPRLSLEEVMSENG